MNYWMLIAEKCPCGKEATLRISGSRDPVTGADLLKYACPHCGRESAPNISEEGAANDFHRNHPRGR